MIAKDQPTIFGKELIAVVSSVEDGAMKFHPALQDTEIVQNRQNFLNKVGITPKNTSLVNVTYETGATFTRYRTIDSEDMGQSILERGDVPVSDALVTTTPEHVLFLPLADCTGMIVYDPYRRVLMVSHLGRHSIVVDGTTKSIAYLQQNFHSNPANMQVWLSPSVGKETYPILDKGGRGQHEIIREELIAAGVNERNIEVCSIDTAKSQEYYSHSEFLQGHRPVDGRFAIVAMMPARNETAS